MTPDHYLSQLKAYSRFVRNFNPAQQQDPHRMLKIAVGPGGDGPRWTEWTDTIMKAWQGRSWSWDIDGLFARHLVDHRSLFRRVRLDLGSADRDEVPMDMRLEAVREGTVDPGLAVTY
jgi:hypothetical protein